MIMMHRFEPAQSGVIRPGSLKLPADTERYPVNANGMIVIDLNPGDLLEIIDPEGRQQCELAIFDKEGQCVPAALSVHRSAEIDSNIPKMLQQSKEGSLRVCLLYTSPSPRD